MTQFVIVEKSGSYQTKDVSKLKLDDLYKKCNFRKSEGFEKVHTFKVKKQYLHVFGRTEGKANQENKFDFPPPIDSLLCFGNMAIVKTEKKELSSESDLIGYTREEWEKDYEKLMGGFETIGSNSEDDYESDELDKYPKDKITKEGYLKDGFVVDDNEADDEREIESDSDEEESYESVSDTEDSDALSREEKQQHTKNVVLGSDSDSDYVDEGESEYTDSELSEEEYMTESDEE